MIPGLALPAIASPQHCRFYGNPLCVSATAPAFATLLVTGIVIESHRGGRCPCQTKDPERKQAAGAIALPPRQYL